MNTKCLYELRVKMREVWPNLCRHAVCPVVNEVWPRCCVAFFFPGWRFFAVGKSLLKKSQCLGDGETQG